MLKPFKMATIESLKEALRQKVAETTTAATQPLSDAQYSTGFDFLIPGLGWTTYQDFIIPQLEGQLAPLLNSRDRISVLDIGPGPKSILGRLPGPFQEKIKKYTAFEPNGLFATRLLEYPLPYLESLPDIRRTPFILDENILTGASDDCGKYDAIILCHSMYGMKPHDKFIEQVIKMLAKGGIAVIFHRDGALHLGGLRCHRMNSFPTGAVSVPDEEDALDRFASFIAGFTIQDADLDKYIRIEWRKVCRALARREDSHPNQLIFSAPHVMVSFNPHSISLPELRTSVPLANEDRYKTIKNREARSRDPASIVRPTEIKQMQQCVRWALKHGFGLTVVGGGHSGHCLWPNTVAIDMSAFKQVHILTLEDDESSLSPGHSLVVAEAGCNTGEIIREAMKAGLTVPLGSRPSVGAGLWLQGGIGHLARLHGLACDSIIGAVMVSVVSGQAFYVGHVPSQYRPAGATRPENEGDLLWAIKGAGTNFGIVVSIVFKAHAAPKFLVRNWVLPLKDNVEAQSKLCDFANRIAKQLPRNSSADAYLYWDADKLHLGVTMYEASATGSSFITEESTFANAILGPENDSTVVDSVGLFETDMYVSKLHGGHGGGKTSSFKRCVFLRNIGEDTVAKRLISACAIRPTPLCYLHLLQGGGAVADVAADATAFGFRNWDFACVITGVWPRDQDDSEISRSVVQWVYDVAEDLLSLGIGAYGADLGPDARDAVLTAKVFGPSLPRLKRLKSNLDPHNVLAYACPLRKARLGPKVIILVTGKSGAGKDYCANVWVSALTCGDGRLKVRTVSISDVTKRDYATATGADLNLLLSDRVYKEQHRPALTAFYQEQIRNRPQLPEEHFLNVVYENSDAEVLLITGMRDEAPVAAFSHLVPESRLLDVRVEVNEVIRRLRRRYSGCTEDGDSANHDSDSTTFDYRPSFVFENDVYGDGQPRMFAEQHLFPFLDKDLQQLADMVRGKIDFPRPGVEFRDVLGIAQQDGGLALCTSLLQAHFAGDWTQVSAIVSCEVGGIVFSSPLAFKVNVPLVLIREAGKLPPPTISAAKPSSYISSLGANSKSQEKLIEMQRNAILPRGASGVSVVVVDDVLSTGETLCAVLQLLDKAGIGAESVSVMVVAEFTVHRGRELLRQRGFGKAKIQSLLVFGGA